MHKISSSTRNAHNGGKSQEAPLATKFGKGSTLFRRRTPETDFNCKRRMKSPTKRAGRWSWRIRFKPSEERASLLTNREIKVDRFCSRVGTTPQGKSCDFDLFFFGAHKRPQNRRAVSDFPSLESMYQTVDFDQPNNSISIRSIR